MGYRRNKKTSLAWKRWRQLSENSILAVGLPMEATETEERWWDYLMHEINVPGYDYQRSLPLDAQQVRLRQLVWSWPGGQETALGQAFVFLERRDAKRNEYNFQAGKSTNLAETQ